jgi:hypothetical protein
VHPRRGAAAGRGMIRRMSGNREPDRLWIELDPASEPIAGVVHDGSESGRPFAGLLELVALVEAERGPAVGPDSPSERP